MNLSMLSKHFRPHISTCISVSFQTWRRLQQVVESLSTTSTRCSVTENTNLLQDSTNRMRNIHRIVFYNLVIHMFSGSDVVYYGNEEWEDGKFWNFLEQDVPALVSSLPERLLTHLFFTLSSSGSMKAVLSNKLFSFFDLVGFSSFADILFWVEDESLNFMKETFVIDGIFLYLLCILLFLHRVWRFSCCIVKFSYWLSLVLTFEFYFATTGNDFFMKASEVKCTRTSMFDQLVFQPF